MDDSVEVEMKDAHVHSNSDDDIQQYVDNMVKVASSIKEVIICRQHGEGGIKYKGEGDNQCGARSRKTETTVCQVPDV